MSVSSESVETFDLGRVLSQTAGLIGRNFVPFAVLALLFAGLPAVLIFFLQLSMMPDYNDPAAVREYLNSYGSYGIFISVCLVLIAFLPTYLLQAALTRAAVDDLSNKGVSLGSALQSGLRYILPLIGLGIVMSFGIAAGMLLLIIPGVILAICWIVSVPVLVVERTGVFAAMQRSLALTRNHRWALFGLLVLFFIGYVIISAVLGLIVNGSMGLAAQPRPSVAFGVISAIVQSFVVLVSTVGIAVVYFELRRIKEGVGVNELASVFD